MNPLTQLPSSPCAARQTAASVDMELCAGPPMPLSLPRWQPRGGDEAFKLFGAEPHRAIRKGDPMQDQAGISFAFVACVARPIGRSQRTQDPRKPKRQCEPKQNTSRQSEAQNQKQFTFAFS